MYNRDSLDSVGIKPTRIIVVLYAIVKELFYLFLVDGEYWLHRAIAGVIMVTMIYVITSSKKLTNRQLSILVPYSMALVEIVLCSLVEGDRLIYIFLVGCSLLSLIYIDTTGLFISMALSCSTAAFYLFVLDFHLMGEKYTMSDELFNFAGTVVINILIFLIGKYSIGALARFRHTGQTFDIVLEVSPNYIAVINEEAKVEYISRSLLRWLKIENPESAINLPFIDLFPSDDLKQLFSEFMRQKDSISDTFEAEIDGHHQWFMLRSVTIGESKVARFFEWADITPIIESQKAAEAAAHSKSAFLARMSHEIRTPMNAVIGITELILREKLSAVMYDHALSIKSAGNNLLSIVNDILDFSKIESGKLDIVCVVYSFASLINDVISIIRVKTTEHSLLFAVNLDSAIPNHLIGDEMRIRQILINLLNNAVKYTREGFVSLTISGELQDENTVLLSIKVSDSGIGIRPEDTNKIFGDFIQVDQSMNKDVQGTGLGLPITKSLCQAMGGNISVCSEYGQGSTFTVLLPQKFHLYEKFVAVPNPSEKKVLLYELRELYADSIAASIRNLGVECRLAQSEEGFREALKLSSYPFIFVSSFLFENAKKMIHELGVHASLVLLSEYGETITEKSVKSIAMPAHSISIANILNDVTDNAGYGGNANARITFSAPSARILIVDDISTNLKVVEGLLSPFNMQIDTCLSGKSAIEKVQQFSYDIVFMDHMMPGMDGIEATRKIREIGGEAYARLPIIALTANAISGARELFLQNGMNDFLSKPIEMLKLISILEKWVPAEKKEKREKKAASAKDTKTTELPFMIKGVDIEAGIRATGGNTDQYMAILSLFYKDGSERIGQIRECHREKDIRLYVTYVHALKSSLFSIGAHELSELAKNLEAAGNDGNMEYISKHNDLFLGLLETLIENIREAVSHTRTDPPAEINKPLLLSLRAALEKMDATTTGNVIDELRTQHAGSNVGTTIEEIYQNILMFEYDEAQKLIDTLL